MIEPAAFNPSQAALVANHNPVGLFLADHTQRISGANPRAVEIITAAGLSWPLDCWHELVHPDDLDAITAALAQWVEAKKDTILTLTFRSKQPEQWLRVRLRYATPGETTPYVGSVVDVSLDMAAAAILEDEQEARLTRQAERIQSELRDQLATTIAPGIEKIVELADAISVLATSCEQSEAGPLIPHLASLTRELREEIACLTGRIT